MLFQTLTRTSTVAATAVEPESLLNLLCASEPAAGSPCAGRQRLPCLARLGETFCPKKYLPFLHGGKARGRTEPPLLHPQLRDEH